MRPAISADCTGEPPGLLISSATAGRPLARERPRRARARAPARVSPRPREPDAADHAAAGGSPGRRGRRRRRRSSGTGKAAHAIAGSWLRRGAQSGSGAPSRRIASAAGVKRAVRLVQDEARREPQRAARRPCGRATITRSRRRLPRLGPERQTIDVAGPAAQRRAGSRRSRSARWIRVSRAAAAAAARRQAREPGGRAATLVDVRGPRRSRPAAACRAAPGEIGRVGHHLVEARCAQRRRRRRRDRRRRAATGRRGRWPRRCAAAMASSSGSRSRPVDRRSPGTRAARHKAAARCRSRRRARVSPALGRHGGRQQHGVDRDPVAVRAAGCSRTRPPSSRSSVSVGLSRLVIGTGLAPPRPARRARPREVARRAPAGGAGRRRCCPRRR